MLNLNTPQYGIKSPAQIQVEKDQPRISENNNSRLGAAALGAGTLAAGGYGIHKLAQGIASNADTITPEGAAKTLVDGVKGTIEVGGNMIQATKDAAGNIIDGAGNIIDTTVDGAGRFIKAVGEEINSSSPLESSTLIVPGATLSYMAEDIDWKGIGEKAKANAGLIAGGLTAGVGAGLAMHNQAAANPDQYDADPVGIGMLGAGLIGTAGAGVGHVIHKAIKDNSEDGKAFQDYKKLNSMPSMPQMPSMPDNYKF